MTKEQELFLSRLTIERFLREIMKEIGYNNSELAAHTFTDDLIYAASKARKDYRKSSLNEDLGLDCIKVLSNYLLEDK